MSLHLVEFFWLEGELIMSAYILFQNDILTEITMWETPGRWGFASMSSLESSGLTANVDKTWINTGAWAAWDIHLLGVKGCEG
jgi:hypothetical protein